MLELTLFGGMTLSREGQPIAWTQRGWQRGALLLLLAAAGRRGMDRLELITLLWPDSEPDAGRHSLDELLSRARRELGEKELFVGTATLSLNRAVISTDVWAFDDAMVGWQLERLDQLYRGPFGSGLRTAASHQLEQRVDNLQRHYHTQWRQAMVRLATNATQSVNHSLAASHWRRLLASDPLDRDAAIGAWQSLAASGRMGEAMAALRAYALLAEESHGTADAEVQSLLARRDTQPVPLLVPALQQEAPSMVEARRRALISRLLGHDYAIGDRLREETLAVVYGATPSVAPSTRVEVHLLQPRLAAGVTPTVFDDIFRRVRGLSHPGILPCLDHRASSDGFVVVTALRTQPTLRDQIKRGSASVREAVVAMLALVDALRHAHERGCIHGNLRPKLIGLTGNTPVMSGFGFGELLAAAPHDQDRSTLVTFGDPRYQSPEQATTNAMPSVVTDVYTIGCIIYEWLTGTRPFDSTRAAGALAQKLQGTAPRVRASRDTVAQSLDDVVATCLARHAADRFPSVAELQRALAAAAGV